ncbi:MAG: glycosyltransferase family 4 protein [Promethearchaeota archaeon]
MKKILFLPTRYFPSISGAEFYLQRMAELLSSKYSYHIDIFTSNAIDFKALRSMKGKSIKKEDKFFKYVNNLKINRFPIEEKGSLQEKMAYIKDIPEYRLLKLSDESLTLFLKNGPYLHDLIEYFLALKDNNYYLAHAVFFPYFNLIITLIAGKIFKIPTICTPFFHFSNPRYLNDKLMEVLRKFDFLIACTNLEKEFLIKYCKVSRENVAVIPMGVDMEKFVSANKPKSTSYKFKEKFFQKKEKKYKMVLFCGYKNYEKGAISLLKSIPMILQKIKKVYFVFIGPSTLAYNRELSKISKIKNSRIINFTPDNLTGYYDKKKLAAFKETDVFCMPSRSDAFGIAFLEAWAAGKPVVGANIGATPEVINNNFDGYLVDFDNPRDIAEKIVKLLKKKKIRKKFGSEGNKKVAQHYSWGYIAEQTHIIYQKLMNN